MGYEWNSELELGQPQIDRQNRQLVSMVNELLSVCKSNRNKEKINKQMNFLVNYATSHFEEEEAFLRACRYPAFDEHKKIHEDFKKTARCLAEKVAKEGPTVANTRTLNITMVGWLINHIKSEDRKMAAYLKC